MLYKYLTYALFYNFSIFKNLYIFLIIFTDSDPNTRG